jgi:hypothetical protein
MSCSGGLDSAPWNGARPPYSRGFVTKSLSDIDCLVEQDMRAFLKHERYELSLDLCGCRVLGSSVLQLASIYGHS